MKHRRSCSECGHHWAWLLSDGRFKCRNCKRVYTWCSVWSNGRLSGADKRKLLEYFVLGVPAYRARFRAPCSRSTTERFYRQIRAVMAIHEELAAPFEGAIECDETMLGGRRRGKRGWGAGAPWAGQGADFRDAQAQRRGARVRCSQPPEGDTFAAHRAAHQSRQSVLH